jgi:hypothetical protein
MDDGRRPRQRPSWTGQAVDLDCELPTNAYGWATPCSRGHSTCRRSGCRSVSSRQSNALLLPTDMWCTSACKRMQLVEREIADEK